MLTNGGNNEGLFRAAFMESGSPVPVGDITNGQKYYDFIVDHTGCSGASDTLQCLRAVPYKAFKAAMDGTPSIFSYQVRPSLSLWKARVLIPKFSPWLWLICPEWMACSSKTGLNNWFSKEAYPAFHSSMVCNCLL